MEQAGAPERIADGQGLVEELRRVRQRGLDASRLRLLVERCQVPRLLGLVGLSVDASIADPSGAAERIAASVERACEGVADAAARALARALFGLHPATKDLSAAAAREYAIGMSGVGERQFRDTREPLVLAAVADALARLARPEAFDPTRGARSAQLLENPSRVFEQLAVDSTLTFAAGRAPRSSATGRRVRCLRDNIDTYVVEVLYTSGAPLELVVTGGGELVGELEPGLSGHRRFEVYLGGYLHAGQDYTLVYEFLVASGCPAPQPYYTISVDTPIPSATMRVRFAEDALPVRVSRIVSVFTSFPVPAEPLRTVEIDRDRMVEQGFEGLREGYAYGLTWQWPSR